MLLHRVDPVYPKIERRIGTFISVRMEAAISEDGRIRDLRVLSRPAGLGKPLWAPSSSRFVARRGSVAGPLQYPHHRSPSPECDLFPV
jgi:hypothetical protein